MRVLLPVLAVLLSGGLLFADDAKEKESRAAYKKGSAAYQAKRYAEDLKEKNESTGENRLYGIVLLSDGKNTDYDISQGHMFDQCLPQRESADVVKVFTIAYGDNADEALLERIAERTNGRAFVADPDNIDEVYEAISYEQ